VNRWPIIRRRSREQAVREAFDGLMDLYDEAVEIARQAILAPITEDENDGD